MDDHDAAAVASGAKIVPCCGFDSVPADVGSLTAAAEYARRRGRPAARVRTYLTKVLGGFSGRGLHLSTFQLNLSASCGIGGAFSSCFGAVLGMIRG